MAYPTEATSSAAAVLELVELEEEVVEEEAAALVEEVFETEAEALLVEEAGVAPTDVDADLVLDAETLADEEEEARLPNSNAGRA